MNVYQRVSAHGALGLSLFLLVTGLTPAAHAEPVKVIAFGDSITRGFGDTSATCDSTDRGYPPRLASRLAASEREVVFVNAGLCGERTREGVSRLDSVLAAHPDASVVILMEGTNDLSGYTTINEMRFNVREMARKVEEAGMTPIVLSVIPRGPGSGLDSDNERTAVFRGWLEYQAEMDEQLFADPFEYLNGTAGLFEFYYFDPWHTNSRGYDLLTDPIVEPALLAIDPPPPPPPPFGLTCTTSEGEPTVPPGPCVTDPDDDTVLCLRDQRFRLDVRWQDFDDNEGAGRRGPQNGDTGTFYFFNETNTELIVKVLNGSNSNGFYWVFYGALSNTRYTMRVVDTETAACKIYENPSGTFASRGDTRAFEGDPPETSNLIASLDATDASPLGAVRGKEPRTAATPITTKDDEACIEDASTLCLQQDRFRVTVDWRLGSETGPGGGVRLSPDTGAFHFFRESNIELVVKVLDGRNANDHFWVFYGALSNLDYTLTVEDTVTGESRRYDNPQGTFASRGDTQAFFVPPPPE